jgi:hypothetical protein
MGGAIVFDDRVSGAAGVGYLLPFLIEMHVLVDHRGKFRLGAEKRFPWTKTVFSDVDVVWRPDQAHDLGSDFEYEASLMYGPSWHWAAGLMVTDNQVGGGVQVRF